MQITTIIAFDIAPGDKLVFDDCHLHVVEVYENHIGGINVRWDLGNGGEPAMSSFRPLDRVRVIKGPGYQL